jgi:hypothetical protein
LITSSCHSCVAYGNYGVIVLKKYINNWTIVK